MNMSFWLKIMIKSSTARYKGYICVGDPIYTYYFLVCKTVLNNGWNRDKFD